MNSQANETRADPDERNREAEIEREQVEWVFGLTGGELNSEPWEGNVYSYDGIPHYAGDDFPDEHDREYVTVVADELCGQIDTPAGYERRGSYTSSGATACPEGQGDNGDQKVGQESWRDNSPTVHVLERCRLCEADPGEDHEEIYLGDGWTEIVFRRKHATFTAEHIDTCFADYLTDHHNRDGELLVGLETSGQTADDAVEEMLNDVAERLPEGLHYSEDDLRTALAGTVCNEDYVPVDDKGNKVEDVDGDDAADEQPSVWVVVKWEA